MVYHARKTARDFGFELIPRTVTTAQIRLDRVIALAPFVQPCKVTL